MLDVRDSYESFAYEWEPDALADDEEEDVKQVLLAGMYHRILHGTINTTACGEVFHTQFAPARSFSLIGPLCPNCHAIPELARSDQLAQLEREAIDAYGKDDDKKGKK